MSISLANLVQFIFQTDNSFALLTLKTTLSFDDASIAVSPLASKVDTRQKQSWNVHYPLHFETTLQYNCSNSRYYAIQFFQNPWNCSTGSPQSPEMLCQSHQSPKKRGEHTTQVLPLHWTMATLTAEELHNSSTITQRQTNTGTATRGLPSKSHEDKS